MGQASIPASTLLQEAKILYPNLGPNPIALVNASFILVTIGQVSLVFIIGTLLFSPYVKRRNITLINLLVVSVFVSIPPALLQVVSTFLTAILLNHHPRYYAGHILDPDPPFGLCLTQAIFQYGSDPMFIIASLALIVELFTETRLLPIRLPRQYRRSFVSMPLP